MRNILNILFMLTIAVGITHSADILSNCAEYSECRRELLDRHWKCSEAPRKSTEQTCGLVHEIRQLYTLSLDREETLTSCIGKRAQQTTKTKLPSECSSFPKIVVLKDCWKSLTALMKRCLQLKRCCPVANSCIENSSTSSTTRGLIVKRGQTVRALMMCRKHMETKIHGNMTQSDITMARAAIRHSNDVMRMVMPMGTEEHGKTINRKKSQTSTKIIKAPLAAVEAENTVETTTAYAWTVQPARRTTIAAPMGHFSKIGAPMGHWPTQKVNGMGELDGETLKMSPLNQKKERLKMMGAMSMSMENVPSVDRETEGTAMVLKVQSSGFQPSYHLRQRLALRDGKSLPRTKKGGSVMARSARPTPIDSEQLKTTQQLIDLLTSESHPLQPFPSERPMFKKAVRILSHVGRSATIRRPWSSRKQLATKKKTQRRKIVKGRMMNPLFAANRVTIKQRGEVTSWRHPRQREIQMKRDQRKNFAAPRVRALQPIKDFTARATPRATPLLLLKQNISRTVATHYTPITMFDQREANDIYEDIMTEEKVSRPNNRRNNKEKNSESVNNFNEEFERKAGTLVSFGRNALPIPQFPKSTMKTMKHHKENGGSGTDSDSSEMEAVINEGGTWTMVPKEHGGGTSRTTTQRSTTIDVWNDPLIGFENRGQLKTANVEDIMEKEEPLPDYIDITAVNTWTSSSTLAPKMRPKLRLTTPTEGVTPAGFWDPFDIYPSTTPMTSIRPPIGESRDDDVIMEPIPIPSMNPTRTPMYRVDHDAIREEREDSIQTTSRSFTSNNSLWPFKMRSRAQGAKIFRSSGETKSHSTKELLDELLNPPKTMPFCSLYHSCLSLLSSEEKGCGSVDDDVRGRQIKGLSRRRRKECMRTLEQKYQDIYSDTRSLDTQFVKCVRRNAFTVDAVSPDPLCSASPPSLLYFSESDQCPRKLRSLRIHCEKLALCCPSAKSCRDSTSTSPLSMALKAKKEKLSEEAKRCQISSYRQYQRGKKVIDEPKS